MKTQPIALALLLVVLASCAPASAAPGVTANSRIGRYTTRDGQAHRGYWTVSEVKGTRAQLTTYNDNRQRTDTWVDFAQVTEYGPW